MYQIYAASTARNMIPFPICLCAIFPKPIINRESFVIIFPFATAFVTVYGVENSLFFPFFIPAFFTLWASFKSQYRNSQDASPGILGFLPVKNLLLCNVCVHCCIHIFCFLCCVISCDLTSDQCFTHVLSR